MNIPPELKYTDNDEWIRIEGSYGTIRITEFAFTCDKLINLPVLKTHYLTRVTLAMKNFFGILSATVTRNKT